MKFVRSTSADILVWTLDCLGLAAEAAEILNHYDEFLRRLDKEELRSHLGRLPAPKVYGDQHFLEFRQISHQFQDALDAAFFKVDTELREFVRGDALF